jgi:hypothetical protein
MFNFNYDLPAIPNMTSASLNNPVSQLIPSAPAIEAAKADNGFPSQSFVELAEQMSQPIPDASGAEG